MERQRTIPQKIPSSGKRKVPLEGDLCLLNFDFDYGPPESAEHNYRQARPPVCRVSTTERRNVTREEETKKWAKGQEAKAQKQIQFSINSYMGQTKPRGHVVCDWKVHACAGPTNTEPKPKVSKNDTKKTVDAKVHNSSKSDKHQRHGSPDTIDRTKTMKSLPSLM